MPSLKPFSLTSSDVEFLLQQINFPTLRIVAYSSTGEAIYGYTDSSGLVHELGPLGSFDALSLGFYSGPRDPIGLRNVDGVFNNLTNPNTYLWGATDANFLRLVHSDYGHYLQPVASGDATAFWSANVGGQTGGADYSDPLANVVDYTPRMISQLVTTSSDAVTASGVPSAMDVAIAAGMDSEQFTFTDTNGVVHTETFVRNVNSVAADPSSSGWLTLFGQFFDHGLDFIAKPGDGPQIVIPLAADDPLYGTIGPDGQPVTKLVITRATPGVIADGDQQYVNHDSPYIDQNQTYGAIDQITLLIREWVSTDGGLTYHAGASLLDGHQSVAYASQVFDDAGAGMTTRTLPTLTELRAALADTNRADLSWEDISNFRLRDANGQLMDTDPNTAGVQTKGSGQAIILDMLPRVDLAHLHPTQFDATTNATVAARVDAAIDTLSTAVSDMGVPGLTFGWNGAHDNIELVIPPPGFGPNAPAGTYTGLTALAMWVDFSTFSILSGPGAVHDAVGEILLSSIGDHYVAGDGRANENFGLTSLHHVFHEDHNVQLVNVENTILAQDIDVRHSWQVDLGFQDSNGNYTLSDGVTVSWNDEMVFQATKLIVEMEYQHVAIDQYARRVTPDLPEFVTYDSNINADISLEYAQAAFRFGHSQLRETIDAIDPNGAVNAAIPHYLLADGFLNPAEFAAEGAGAIATGMSRQVANEIDEFVTPALQQSLLGQPLDLAAINIARGRDVGLPTLNETRKALYDALVAERASFGDTGPHAKIQLDLLRPYNSWNEFAAGMGHPESLVNFIAAYAFDGDRDHAQAILDADATGVDNAYTTAADASLFLAGARNADGSYVVAGADSFNNIDLWLGGLAESHVLGGLLGPTFNAIFEDQMERLMDGDRFYYLYRLDAALPALSDLGQSIVTEQFHDIIERTTGAIHLNGDIMSHADDYIELGQTAQTGVVLLNSDGTERYGPGVTETPGNAHKYGSLLVGDPLGGYGVYSTFGRGIGANGTVVYVENPEDHTIHQYLLDQRPDAPINNINGNPNYGYNSHEVIGGTQYNDFIDAGDGDDTIYGDAGNDVLIGNGGGDHIYGGDGNDVMYGGGGTAGADVQDFMDGGAGMDIMYGGQNNAAIEVMIGGDGNDQIYGESGIEEIYGGFGDDRIDAGGDTDLAFGGYGNDYMYGGEGPDELHGQAGDDIISGGTGQDKLLGEAGDDILLPGIGGGVGQGDSDEVSGDIGFDLASFTDITGAFDVAADLNQQNLQAAAGAVGFEPFNAIFIDMEGVIGSKFDDAFAGNATNPFGAGLIGDANGNWLIGGSGNDKMVGGGGNDVIIGDSIRLDVLIGKYMDGANPDSYSSYVEGAENRVAETSVLAGGVFDWAELGGAFDKHFTDLIKSAAYKDFVLGDGASSGANDVAIFTGARSEYTIELLDVNGNPTSDGASAFAVKVTDNTAGRDGVDLLVGVESLQFSDQLVSTASVNQTPTGAPDFQASTRTISGQVYALLEPTSQIFDPDNVTLANPTGAVNVPAAGYDWQTSADGGMTWTSVAVGAAVNQQDALTRALTLGQTAGTLTHLEASYVDNGGYSEHVYSPTWNVIVGNGGTNALAGTDSTTIADIIFGLNGADAIIGGAGDDFIAGGGGNDAISAGLGNDTILYKIGDGTDTINGGDGIDTLMVVGSSNNDNAQFTFDGLKLTAPFSTTNVEVFTLDLGAGVDQLNYQASAAAVAVDLAAGTASGFTSIAGVENVRGGAGADTITGDDNANVLLGLGGADTINGGGGDDIIGGGAGNDIINAGDGNDTINYVYAGQGNDFIDGGAGVDTVSVTGTSGNNVARFQWDGTVLTAPFTLTNVESVTLDLGNGADQLSYGGNTVGVTIDLMSGVASGFTSIANVENLRGGNGADLLIGNNNANDIIAAGGADTIIGGGGNDIMSGGGGSDTFVFLFGSGHDVISDFDANPAGGQDHLDISGYGVTAADFASHVSISVVAGDTVITIDGTETITLTGVTSGVDINDFFLAP